MFAAKARSTSLYSILYSLLGCLSNTTILSVSPLIAYLTAILPAINASSISLPEPTCAPHLCNKLNSIGLTLTPNLWLTIDAKLLAVPPNWAWPKASLATLASDAVTGDTTWGPDGNLWKVTAQALFADRSQAIDLKDYVDTWDSKVEYGTNASNAIVLLAASALNEDVRNTEKYGKFTYNEKEYDYLAYMFAKFYSEELGLMKVTEADKEPNFSTNQVYCGLLAYKVMRDSKKAANIFGTAYEAPKTE